MDVPRRRQLPDDEAVEKLVRAAEARRHAEAELREAVYAASDAGGSIRVIAELAQVGTRTVQDWLKNRPQ